MNITIARESLLKPLQLVSGVVEKRQTLPILSNILLTLRDGTLSMTGTDLEVEIQASIAVDTRGEYETTLPARKFIDICRSLPDGAQITIEFDNDKALIKSGRSKFTLATLPATDYPSSENINKLFELTLPQATLKGLIDRTSFCMANQDVRYYLNGLMLEMERNFVRSVATDGHRLAMMEVEIADSVGDKRQVIVPRKGVVELNRLLSDDDTPCNLQMSHNFLRIVTDEIQFTSKLIDGRFPDYDRVIPKGGDKIVLADRQTLKQALNRASILSNEKYRGIRLNLQENTILASVNNPEQEEAEEIIDVQYNGPTLEIGFNVSYIIDALNVINTERVTLALLDSNSSCLIQGEGQPGTKYVVMPMRL